MGSIVHDNTPARLILASASPRRRELIAAIDATVEVVSPHDAETPVREGEKAEQMVRRLSMAKARQVADLVRHAIVIGADTTVVLDEQVMGKPASHEEAVRMLDSLRGRSHRVVTGLTLIDTDNQRCHTATRSSEVRMRRYSDVEIAAYVASGEPMDKAGGYAVQDGCFRPAAWVSGCYLNVVGLPLCDLMSLLEGLGVDARLMDDWRPPERCVDCALRDGRQVSGP